LKYFRIGKRRTLKQVLDFAKDKNIELMLFTMVSPYDYFLIKGLKAAGIKVAFVFHDFRRHPGDLWPSTRLLKKILKNIDVPIFLSNYVRRQAGQPNRSQVINFPKLINPEMAVEADRFDYDYGIFGRQHKYTGIKDYANAIDILGPKYNAIIQGDFRKFGNGVVSVSGWLSEDELLGFITRTTVILCLHLEASQSGIINISHQLGRPVVARNVGGISEQLNPNNGVLVASIDELPGAMLQAMKLSPSKVRPTDCHLSLSDLKSNLECFVRDSY
jgi:glycosyltransferase involved in cell wall biosynthesis